MTEPALASPEVSPPTRSRASARQDWQQRLERFARSGLSPAQFCTAEGVSLPSFYSWRRRLARDTGAPPTAPVADVPPGPRLLPVRLPAGGAVVELVLPSGAVLRVPAGCDLAFVRLLVEALGGAPC